MNSEDLVRHGCARSIAAAAISALARQAQGIPLNSTEERMIRMATPAITRYRKEQEA